MTDYEVEAVAELLAKIGGSWFPDRVDSGRKMVMSRHKEGACLVLDEIKRIRAKQAQASEPVARDPSDREAQFSVGETVEYAPPGDKRTVTCRIEKLEPGRAYVTPVGRQIGWISTHSLVQIKS